MNFKLDEAELFGTRVATFAVNGGDEGTLRVSGGRYSVKLRNHLSVIPVEGAVVARIVRVDVVDDRTAVLVEKAQKGCNYKYQLLSIRQGDVLSWDFGDCNSQPLTAMEANQVTYDFTRANQLTRFTYRDARLVRNDSLLNAPPPAPQAAGGRSNGTTATIGGDRYVPGLPFATAAAGAPDAATAPPMPSKPTSAAPAPKPAARPVAASTAPAAKPLNFPAAGEQTPIRIVLDK